VLLSAMKAGDIWGGHGTAFSTKCRQYHDDSHIKEAQLRLVVTIVAVCLFTVGGGSVHLSCATC